jgi:hypothetical protein
MICAVNSPLLPPLILELLICGLPDVDIEDFHLNRPSLDDVFLSLTGHAVGHCAFAA